MSKKSQRKEPEKKPVVSKSGAKKTPAGQVTLGVVPRQANTPEEDNNAVVSKVKDSDITARSYVKKAAIRTQASSNPDIRTVLKITGDQPEHKLTSFQKMELVESGLSKNALLSLKEKAKIDYDQLARVLNVARATLINKKGNEKFSKDVSDKILGLADIYSYGYEVFEDVQNFNQWVFRENPALGGKAPFNLLHNSFGREEVKHLIGRIDYGVYS